jgi:hypothetical protein
VARFVFSSNSAFAIVTNKQFMSLMEALQQRKVTLPTRRKLVRHHLPEEYATLVAAVKKQLQGTWQTLSMDGWTAPQSESMMASTIANVLNHWLNCQGQAHTGVYLPVLCVCALLPSFTQGRL